MRLAASSFLVAALALNGCATKCDMNRCPEDSSHSDASVAYYDGSGNAYIFYKGTVEYQPVTPDLSSSGRYSGGTPFKRPIDAPTFAKIARALNTAIDAQAAHIPDRVMLSGAISIKCGDESRDWIIAPGSAELVAIESLMTTLKAAGNNPPRP